MNENFKKLYQSIQNGALLELNITEKSDDCLEIILKNVLHKKDKQSVIKKIGFLGIFYGFYLFCIGFKFLIVDFLFLVVQGGLVYQFFNLIHSEKITVVKDFALQICTTFTNGRISNFYLPLENVQDVVINEVISKMKVIYILVVLTKGDIHKKKPIIPLLSKLNPNLEILEESYRQIQKKLSLI